MLTRSLFPLDLRDIRFKQAPVRAYGSYVDGPLASVFISAVNGWRPSVICPASWRGLGPLALMKSDDPRLPIKGELWAPDPLRSVRWSSIVSPCRSSRLRRARQTLEPAFSFRVRCPRLKSGLGVDGDAEGLAGGDDRPDDPGELVGQRHGHDLGRFARSERGQPVAQRALALWRRPQDRDGAQHQKPSDITIALLSDRTEFLLAAGRVLLGRHAKPGGEIAAGFEDVRIWGAGQNRRSGERADAGDARCQPADRIASMVGGDCALELVDRRLE